jgi:hypothetical protein
MHATLMAKHYTRAREGLCPRRAGFAGNPATVFCDCVLHGSRTEGRATIGVPGAAIAVEILLVRVFHPGSAVGWERAFDGRFGGVRIDLCLPFVEQLL